MMRPHRQAHARIWLGLAILLPLALIAGLLSGSRLPSDAPPVRLDAAQGQKP